MHEAMHEALKSFAMEPVGFAFIFAALILLSLAPVIAIAPLHYWTQWLLARTHMPRGNAIAVYVLLGLDALVFVVSMVVAAHSFFSPEVDDEGTSNRARALADAITDAMNGGFTATMIVIGAMVWLFFQTRRWHWRATVIKG